MASICPRQPTWYPKLVPAADDDKRDCLLKHVSDVDLSQGLIVCVICSDLRRYFALFPSHVEFFSYYRGIDPELKCYHEVIHGDKPQKPRFDIDINADEVPNAVATGVKVKEALISAVIAAMKVCNITLNLSKDLVITSSHGPEKASFHIIINNYAHANSEDAMAFYQLTMSLIPDADKELVRYIDRGIYAPNHPLRMLGSKKEKTDRYKVIERTFTYNSQTYTYQYPPDTDASLQDMEDSLVTVTGNCAILPSLKGERREDPNAGVDLEPHLQRVFEMLKLWEGGEYLPYKFDKVRANKIYLTRVESSYCKLCQRQHERENPCVYFRDGAVMFTCRRTSRPVQIGVLDPTLRPSSEPAIWEGVDILEKIRELREVEKTHPLVKQREPKTQTSIDDL